jgi:hypothetical protein
MPSSAIIRVQQPSVIKQNNHSNNNNNSPKHTISMFRLFLYIFNYIYLLNTKIFSYVLSIFKRVSRFLLDVWTFVFVTLRGSKKKVKLKCLFI